MSITNTKGTIGGKVVGIKKESGQVYEPKLIFFQIINSIY